jgi:ABC-type transport system involved in cytochrome bd biosynthesis fused ATPase/permease subunit
MRGRTTFIIAHRLSTLGNCDLRLELENGRLLVPVRAVRAPSSLGGAILSLPREK